MKTKIRIACVGAGMMIRKHLEVLSTFEDVQLVGITSRTKHKAEALAREFSIEICADNLEALISDTKPDGIYIGVSEDQTYPVVTQALMFGVPLFIEKPAGINEEQNRDLAQIAEKFNTKTMVGFNRRYYSLFHKGLEIIRQHGPLHGIAIEGHERMWRIREGGKFQEAVMNDWIFANSSHTIDLLRFFGGEIKDMASYAKRSFNEARGDQFVSAIDFKDGALGQYQAHWYSPGGWRVVLYGSGVTVEFKPLEQGRYTDKQFNVHEILPDQEDTKFKPGLYGQARAFVDLARTGNLPWPGIDLKGAYETMVLAKRMTCL